MQNSRRYQELLSAGRLLIRISKKKSQAASCLIARIMLVIDTVAVAGAGAAAVI